MFKLEDRGVYGRFKLEVNYDGVDTVSLSVIDGYVPRVEVDLTLSEARALAEELMDHATDK